MTIKAKRAKALPVFDRELDWGTGGFVDESLPSEVLPVIDSLSGLLSSDFQDWFKQRIGRYRAHKDMAKNTPPLNEEARLLTETQRYVLETRLRLENLPPTVDAYINEACWKRQRRLFHGYGGFLSEFSALAREIDTLLAITEQKMGNLPLITGRPTKNARDSFLSDVAAYLKKQSKSQLTKRAAAEHAQRLLLAAGVDVPQELKEVERLISKWEKGKKGKTACNWVEFYTAIGARSKRNIAAS